MNKINILNRLFSLQRRGIKPGLERTLELLENLNNPHKKFLSIHIAGTNGKGSVSSLIASVLMEAGYKVGLYTSPHISDFNERIRINGEKISDKDLINYSIKILKLAEKNDSTFFEITTAMAFDYFADSKVDVAVVETGMGGRFDSTNTLTPIISIITNIDLDHLDFLGDTLERIAGEKAGIIKAFIPIVCGETKPEALDVIKSKATQTLSDLILPNEVLKLEKFEYTKSGMAISFNNLGTSFNITTPLIGAHQIDNHATAISAILNISKRLKISEENLIDGIKNVKDNTGLKFRLEKVNDSPLTIIDVGHNPAAFNTALKSISEAYNCSKWHIVYGSMADKDYAEILTIIKPYCEKLYVATPKIDRSAPGEIISKKANRKGIKSEYFNSIEEAYVKAIESGKPVFAAGSFHVAEEIEEYLTKSK